MGKTPKRNSHASQAAATPASTGKKYQKKPATSSKPVNKGRSKKKVAHESDEETDGEGDDDDEVVEVDKDAEADRKAEEKKRNIDWIFDNYALSFELIKAISDDKVIRNIIFPPKGAHASTEGGGGKNRTEGFRMVHESMFEDHPTLKEVYRADRAKFDLPSTHADAAEGKMWLEKWNNKIKNRVVAMTKEVTKNLDVMGRTGAGLKSADLIIEGSDIDNAWTVVKKKCPYFFEMRDLMGERPSLVPTGLGNSDTPIDMSVLDGKDDEAEVFEEEDIEDVVDEEECEDAVIVEDGSIAEKGMGGEDSARGSGPELEDQVDMPLDNDTAAAATSSSKPSFKSVLEDTFSDSDDEVREKAKKRKRAAEKAAKANATPSNTPAKKSRTAARAATATAPAPAPAPAPSGRKKTNKTDQLSDMMTTEHEVQISEINLAKVKAEREVARVQGKNETDKMRIEGQVKKEEGRNNLKLEKVKLQQLEMQYKIKRMEAMQQAPSFGPFGGPGFGGSWLGPQGMPAWGMPPGMYGPPSGSHGAGPSSGAGFNGGTGSGGGGQQNMRFPQMNNGNGDGFGNNMGAYGMGGLQNMGMYGGDQQVHSQEGGSGNGNMMPDYDTFAQYDNQGTYRGDRDN